MTDKLLVETLRPNSLDDIILTPTTRRMIGDGRLHQNMLFTGPAGTGKTSLAKIVTDNYPHIYINVSDESSVEVIRTRIKEYCATYDMLYDGQEDMKAVILDEMDGASDQFYKALRGVIEQYADAARFVGTCNDISKIPEAIQSRFLVVPFAPVSSEEENELYRAQAKRLYAILKDQKIKIDKEALVEFVKRNFPDMRSMIKKVQGWTVEGITEIKADEVRLLNYAYRDMMEVVCSAPSPQDNYEFITKRYASRVNDVLASLGSDLPKFVMENHPDLVPKLPYAYIIVADAQRDRTMWIDPIVGLLATMAKLQLSFHSDYNPVK